MKTMMKILLLRTLLIVLFLANVASAADKPQLALEGKFDGQKVKLRWMTTDKSLDYEYLLWRAPAYELTKRVKLAELKKLDYEEAKQKLKDNDVALKLMYPLKAAANRAELNQSLSQGENRLSMLLFVSTEDARVAAALGQYFEDTAFKPGQQFIYTVEAYKKGQLVASKTRGIRTDKVAKLPMLWEAKAHKFAWGVGLKWEGYEPYVSFNIYRGKTFDGDFEQINTAPVQVQTSLNKDGTMSVAPYFFTDTTLKEHEQFYYQIRGVDFFGDEGPASIPVLGKIKKDPRPAPLPRPVLEEGETSINILWQPAADKKVVAYNVYRSLKYEGGYRKLNPKPIAGTSYLDSSVALDTNYFYYVTTINEGGFESIPSLAVLGFAKDSTPPAVVAGLGAEIVEADVNLSWSPVTDADLLGYRVYRTMKPNSLDWALLNKEPLAVAAYIDALTKNLSRYPYYYRITAVDTHHNESKPSAVVKIQLPDVTPPGTPSVTGYTVKNQQVSLSWQAVKSYDLAGYHVYRLVDNKSMRLTETPLSLPAFTDQMPPIGKALQYAITAIDLTGNESAKSATINVVAKDSVAPGIAAFKINVQGDKVLLKVTTDASDSAGFDVYRSRNNRDFVKVNPSRVTETSYSDQVLKGKRYFYKVVLWDQSANKAESAAREVTLPK